MAGGRREHQIIWHAAQLASSEHASLVEADAGYRFRGLVVLPLDDVPCHIEYEVVVDPDWRARAASATVTTPAGAHAIELRSDDGGGHWTLEGHAAPHLDGCGDVDLGWTPATNTVPIRRLGRGLGVGETASVTAAWVRFPGLDVVADQQRYTRLAADRWRYRSGDYDFELVTDPATGLVLGYGDDLWQAVATSFGRSDSGTFPPAAHEPVKGRGDAGSAGTPSRR